MRKLVLAVPLALFLFAVGCESSSPVAPSSADRGLAAACDPEIHPCDEGD